MYIHILEHNQEIIGAISNASAEEIWNLAKSYIDSQLKKAPDTREFIRVRVYAIPSGEIVTHKRYLFTVNGEDV